MATVHEILKASGMTDDQIAAIDAKAVTAMKNVLDTADKTSAEAIAKAEADKKAAADAYAKAQADLDAATKAREQAELEKRSNVEFYETRITPALAGWDEAKKNLEIAKANAEAKAAFFETQIAGAKAAGFLPADTPAFVLPNQPAPVNSGNLNQPRDDQGRFMTNMPGSIPGSPTFMTPEQAGDRLATFADLNWEYQRLYGQPMPMSPSQLVTEAEKIKLDPRAYAERYFKFPEKRQELADKQKAEERAQIAAEAVKPLQEQLAAKEKEYDEKIKAKDREWAERFSSNGDVRVPVPSKFADVARAVKDNQRPDPLNLSEAQRRQATSSAIRQEIAQNSAA